MVSGVLQGVDAVRDLSNPGVSASLSIGYSASRFEQQWLSVGLLLAVEAALMFHRLTSMFGHQQEIYRHLRMQFLTSLDTATNLDSHLRKNTSKQQGILFKIPLLEPYNERVQETMIHFSTIQTVTLLPLYPRMDEFVLCISQVREHPRTPVDLIHKGIILL